MILRSLAFVGLCLFQVGCAEETQEDIVSGDIAARAAQDEDDCEYDAVTYAISCVDPECACMNEIQAQKDCDAYARYKNAVFGGDWSCTLDSLRCADEYSEAFYFCQCASCE